MKDGLPQRSTKNTRGFYTPFVAVFTNEVLLNTKRVAPYLLMALFAANAALWWAKGPAVQLGWATNSDFYIARNMGGFSVILGLPIFTAIIMGDVVIRDFRLGVAPLIFSKPIGRGSYLLGKFFGNFFVLVCCQSSFAITLCLLQWVPYSGMVVLPVRVLPYFQHFFIIVVISHLLLAAIYFTAGALTRNARLVYGIAACFYPVFMVLSFLVKDLPSSVHILIDPIAFNLIPKLNEWHQSAAFLNQYVSKYSLTAYANRAWVIALSSVLLLVTYVRFRIDEPQQVADNQLTKLMLADESQRIAYSAPSYGSFESAIEALPARDRVALPKVTSANGGAATLSKIAAAMGVEFQLLRAERGLILLLPLAIVLSFLSVPFSRIASELSYSVISATGTANMLILFLVGVLIFYTGEAMHRDRELRIEPVIWSLPAPNAVLLLSKWLAMTLVALSLVFVGNLTTIATQLLRGYTPIDFSAYGSINLVVVVPSILFMTSFVVALNVLLRNKYLTYAVAVGIGAALFYLYNVGYNHWLYNPVLYRLWNYADLTSLRMLAYRLYCLALAILFLALAHIFFERKSV